MNFTNYANRGKASEEAVEWMSTMYKARKLALVHKIPVPTIHMSNKTRKLLKFLGKGEFIAIRQQSTVDYEGFYKGGKSLCFDVKETNNKNTFPLRTNLHQHQYDYLTEASNLGADAFLLIIFKDHPLNTVYKLDIENCPSPKETSSLKRDYIKAKGSEVLNWDYLFLLKPQNS